MLQVLNNISIMLSNQYITLDFPYLMHRVSQKSLQNSIFTRLLFFEALEEMIELWFLFVFRQHLEAVVVVAHVLLVDSQHR